MLTTKNAAALLGEIIEKGPKVVKIKLIRNTVVNGKAELAGKTVKTDKETAKLLIAIKKALPVGGGSPEVENREDEIVINKRKKTGRNRRIKPDGN